MKYFLNRFRLHSMLVAAILVSCLASAHAQQGQVRRLIVPFPPGGAADYLGRLVADKLKDQMGQHVIVENRPGAGVRIGASALKSLPADGATAMLVPDTTMWIGPEIYRNLPFDPPVDFKAVTDVAMVQLGLGVAATSPVNSLADLVAAAKASPGRGTLGITVIGSLGHFIGSEFASQSRAGITLVPYNGAAPMMTNLLGEHLAAGIDGITTFVEPQRMGKARLLAVAGTKRSKLVPDVPTFSELGYPSLVADGRYVLYVRSDVPETEVAKWNQAVRKVLALPEVQEKLERLGFDVVPGSAPEETARAVKATADRWLPVIRASGFKAD